jgi:hypothetical protein
MVQDGGTGASLKRVFIQQEALGLPVPSDQTSNYGGMSGHGLAPQSYQLPLKGGVKRISMQGKQSKQANTSTISASSGTVSVQGGKKRRDLSDNSSVGSRTNTSKIADTPNL